MDIQRGDQVYYRGEVWTVQDLAEFWDKSDVRAFLIQPDNPDANRYWVRPNEVQRVEQVR